MSADPINPQQLSPDSPPTYICIYIYIYIIIWGVPHSRQYSRCYIAAENKTTLKIRYKAWHSQKCKKCRRTKSKRLVEVKRQTLTGKHWRQRREKPIMGHRISRAFNQHMENRKANLTLAANRGASRAIKWPCVRRVWPGRGWDKETSKWRHGWEHEDYGPRKGFN